MKRISTLCTLLLMTTAALAQGDLEMSSLEELLSVEIETAAKYDQKVRDAPGSVTVITAEEIKRFGYRSLADVLRNVRGFYLSHDRNYGYLGVRGFGRPGDFNSRILLMINEHPINENFSGSFGADFDPGITLSAVERIEIVRGPGSALYGSGAMFAVINLVTRSPEQQAGGAVEVGAGSHGLKFSDLVWGRQFGELGILLAGGWTDQEGEDLYFEEYDDPSTNHGVYEDNDWLEWSSGFLELSWKGLEAQVFVSQRDKGIPTGSFATDYNDPTAETTDEFRHLTTSYKIGLGDQGSFQLRAAIDDYRYSGVYPYDGVPWVDSNRGHWWTLAGQLTWDFNPSNRSVLGLEYVDHSKAEYFAFDGYDVVFDRDIPYHTRSAFAQHEVQISPDLALTLGLRWDNYSDVGSHTTPRAALVWHPNERMTLKALWGEAFRRPNHYERYYEDAGVNIANPDVQPESITTAELIWEQQLRETLYGTVSVFRYEIADLITGLADEEGVVQFVNIDEATAIGVEMQLDLRLDNGIWGTASWTYQDAEDKMTGSRLTNAPEHLLRFGLNAPVTDYLFVGGHLRWEDERLSVYETRIEEYFLLDLHLTTPTLWNHWELSMHVMNVFDEFYETPGGFEHEQDGIVQPGRMVRFGLGVVF